MVFPVTTPAEPGPGESLGALKIPLGVQVGPTWPSEPLPMANFGVQNAKCGSRMAKLSLQDGSEDQIWVPGTRFWRFGDFGRSLGDFWVLPAVWKCIPFWSAF